MRLIDLWGYNKSGNIRVVGVPKGEEKEGEAARVLKKKNNNNG